ncbi:DUF7093 family protein [Halospeciosus flavus]|uniref:DUF7093 family protein n=1 Tax=Halospeciosus flavus TaxID=3032283 RepID=UPI00361B7AC2
MGLKCSLLGHDYGDVEVERSREEQGNEVVETVREVKHCERCGAESVVSENTEVRTAVDAETVGLDADTEDTGTADADDGADGSAGERDLVSAVSHVGDETGGEGDESEPEPTTEQSTQHESRFDDVTAGDAADHPRVGDDDGFEAATDATEDDAIILDEEGEEPDAPDRQPGQWPAADDTRQEERDTEVLQTEPRADSSRRATPRTPRTKQTPTTVKTRTTPRTPRLRGRLPKVTTRGSPPNPGARRRTPRSVPGNRLLPRRTNQRSKTASTPSSSTTPAPPTRQRARPRRASPVRRVASTPDRRPLSARETSVPSATVATCTTRLRSDAKVFYSRILF